MSDFLKKYEVVSDGGDVVVRSLDHFDPDLVFDCGQCFRFAKKDGVWQGVARGRLLRLTREGDDLRIFDMDTAEFESSWLDYLGLTLDYDIVRESFDAADSHLSDAADVGQGIRILGQEPWEALISFIISQNNNIPRIRSLVERLCVRCGKKFSANGEDFFAFPTPDEMATLDESDFAEMGMGYRAAYLVDATRGVREGRLLFDELYDMPTDRVIDRLKCVKGVGTKVASCVALFGLGKYDAFPIDVWVKRILAKYYPDRADIDFGPYAGIAQQYLFYFERYIEGK